MKRILFLFAGLVALSTNAFGTNNTATEAEASINNYVSGYGNSFIFNEAGIEFSVFADGQFDFYMSNYGPDVNVGINSPSFSLSFNSGFNYNPYVQYDSFGAIIQVENTPIFYDYYGRVNQIGNIFINYNGFGRIHRIGGLNIHYRNNVFWRYDGFINVHNSAYVWRPWHRFYAVPNRNFCLVNANPYRQFYAPVRHTYYRPYKNNVRNFNVTNGRRGNAQVGRRNGITRNSNQYAQTPRNGRERNVSRTVQRNNREITRTRTSRLRENNMASNSRTYRNAETSSTQSHTQRSDEAKTTRSNASVTSPNRRSRNDRATATRSRSRAKSVAPRLSNTKNVSRSSSSVFNKKESKRTASVRKPNTTKSRLYNKATSQSSKQRSTIQNKRESSSVTTRSNTSRKRNQSSTRSNSNRSRG
jgi:hypothetical protein